jgi:acetylornithine deacetylase
VTTQIERPTTRASAAGPTRARVPAVPSATAAAMDTVPAAVTRPKPIFRSTRPLYVIKAGSATLDRGAIHKELADLVARGARVLLVAGGATGIERHYAAIDRPMPQLRLVGGDSVRYCPPEEMAHLVDA